MSGQRVLVIGSGLSGATAAWALRRDGINVEILETAESWGGQLRTASAAGILYEPYGAHIFHTKDTEVWKIATSIVSMRPYQHRVMTEVEGQLLSWPPQVDELRRLAAWQRIDAELSKRPAQPDATNFETWCLDVMGPTLYSWFVEPYTRKQWGLDPSELSSTWAPKRLELRTDGHTGLFRDPHEGWPHGGYLGLIDGLLRGAPAAMGVTVSAENFEEITRGADATIVTAPLDSFFNDCLGKLPWRGVHLISRYYPEVDHVLACGVVNHPGMDKAYTRRIETKWMSGQTDPGTVVSEEYPGAEARHYPIDDADGRNRALARDYRQLLEDEFGDRVFTAGRLATYTYIDMDQSMRQGLNVATEVQRRLAR